MPAWFITRRARSSIMTPPPRIPVGVATQSGAGAAPVCGPDAEDEVDVVDAGAGDGLHVPRDAQCGGLRHGSSSSRRLAQPGVRLQGRLHAPRQRAQIKPHDVGARRHRAQARLDGPPRDFDAFLILDDFLGLGRRPRVRPQGRSPVPQSQDAGGDGRRVGEGDALSHVADARPARIGKRHPPVGEPGAKPLGHGLQVALAPLFHPVFDDVAPN